jgi:hypothetical protein
MGASLGISMNLIRRAVALTAATAMAALVTAAASACGGAPTATATTTNGLEKKSAADVLQEAAAALAAAKSVHVHVVGTGLSSGGHVDVRLQGGSSTGAFAQSGPRVEFTVIGNVGYIKTDQAGLQQMGLPRQVQRHDAGRWLEVRAQDFTGFTLAGLAAQLTTYQGPLEPKVRQATVNGRKLVVIRWRNGGKLYVANTGPAYPFSGELKGQNAGRIEFTEYGAPLHIAAPSNAIDLRPL